ncbi:MAG: hypothetical protein ACI9TK_000672 [Flavobacteriaceae bacterium]|jgi:hypothetical protein|tara:strand:+ start:3309 stop:4820 length:1512 start_codon:yes stop_codon:yes gene_type:complete
MRYFTLLFGILLITQNTVAQNINDISRFLSTDLNGSARHTSMAGAFGALGGDLTSISYNPASSSVFLNSEFGASINYKNKRTNGTYFGTSEIRENDAISLDHFGAVFVFNNNNIESPWSRISLGINFHKIVTYDQNAFLGGNSSNGIDKYFEYYAEGLAFENLPVYEGESVSGIYRTLGEENGFAAQQAFLGYQSYIINPFSFEDGNTQYYSNVDYNQVNHQLTLKNEGWHRKTSFNFSGLYKNKLHVGINLNSHNLNYISNQKFFETDQALNSNTYNINFKNNLTSLGKGFSTQIGGILRLNNIRLGATYDSPQWLTIRDETSQSINAFHFEDGSTVNELIDPNITNIYEFYKLKIPSKTTLSFAYVFGNKGVVSVDYSSQNAGNTMLNDEYGSDYLNTISSKVDSEFGSINSIKIGGEYRLKDISLRAGLLSRNTAYKNSTADDLALTLGLGIDFGASNLSLSLVNFEQNKDFKLFSKGLTNPYYLSQNLTQVSISYNIKL